MTNPTATSLGERLTEATANSRLIDGHQAVIVTVDLLREAASALSMTVATSSGLPVRWNDTYTVPSHEAPRMPGVEEVARIIDPGAWKTRDWIANHPERNEVNKGRSAAYMPNEDELIAPSLTKAAEIFALFDKGGANG